MITAQDIHTNARYTTVDGEVWMKLSAVQQRELLGYAVFGKKPVQYDRVKQGWYVQYTTLSRDITWKFYTNEKIAALVNNKEKVTRQDIDTKNSDTSYLNR